MRFLVVSLPVQDLLLRANYLFIPAMMAAVPYWGARRSTLRFDESRSSPQRKSNDATMNPHGGSSDERAIADT
jgi:hypothetical protein